VSIVFFCLRPRLHFQKNATTGPTLHRRDSQRNEEVEIDGLPAKPGKGKVRLEFPKRGVPTTFRQVVPVRTPTQGATHRCRFVLQRLRMQQRKDLQR
jgi:hypothetical protein